MALTTWKNAPNGMIRNPDVSIAKNYLNEMEMDDLNRIVSMYLDYAERQAKKRTSDVHERLGEKVGRIFAVQRISRPTTGSPSGKPPSPSARRSPGLPPARLKKGK